MYDIVIIGAGVAGMTLADALVAAGLDRLSVAIVDRHDDPNYNISFWTAGETRIEPVVKKTWSAFEVRYGDRRVTCQLDRYRLKCFWRDDFDTLMQSRLREQPNIEFIEADVGELVEGGSVVGGGGDVRAGGPAVAIGGDLRAGGSAVASDGDLGEGGSAVASGGGAQSAGRGGDHVVVNTASGTLRGRWVFDSRPLPARPGSPDWVMQGLAAEVTIDPPKGTGSTSGRSGKDRRGFDPWRVTLFDFFVDSSALDFMYVMPYTAHSALVNVALMTPASEVVSRERCQAAIAAYLGERYGVDSFETGLSAYGRIRLTEQRARRRRDSRVVPIGVRAGMLKGSTSYAYGNIVEDSTKLADALARTGAPHYETRFGRLLRTFERSSARVFQTDPRLAQDLMFEVFDSGACDRALAFLDDDIGPLDYARIFASMPLPIVRRVAGAYLAAAMRSS